MKLLFLIADGMGDWPVEALGGQTPLAYGRTPHMDALARDGIVGTCRTVPPGMAPGSDVANMALLGFDPATHHTGRGPIEAAAQGLELAPDDLVYRLNLVTVDPPELIESGTMRDYSSGHITTEASTPLVEDLASHFGTGEFQFFPGVQYRHLLVHKGAATGVEAGIRVEPPHDITDKPLAHSWSELAKSPALLELVQNCSARLRDNPANATKANAVWPWGQGRPLSLPSFFQRSGLHGAVISAVDLIRGLGRAAAMQVVEVEGATGLVNTNYLGKVVGALDFLRHGGDFAFVHLEGPDECGHGGDVWCKVIALERFDKLIVGPLLRALAEDKEDLAVLVTCDHLTPLAIRTHHEGPVPFLLWSSRGLAPNGAGNFSEVEAAKGVFIEPGHTLLDWVLRQLGLPAGGAGA